MSNKRLGILFVLVIIGGLCVLSGVIVVGFMIRGNTLPFFNEMFLTRNDRMVVEDFSKGIGAIVEETSELTQPWGDVRVYEGTNQFNHPVTIEVDKSSNIVTAYETYGPQPSEIKITKDQAQDSAVFFLNEYFPDIQLEGLEFTTTPPEESSSIMSFGLSGRRMNNQVQ